MEIIMTLDEVKRLKKQYGYTNAQMALLSGLPLSTVQKVLGGTTASPRWQTIAALASVFPEHLIKNPISGAETGMAEVMMMQEAPAAYAAARKQAGSPAGSNPEDAFKKAEPESTGHFPRQGSYTLEDYLALPDEQRAELIDGVFYDMGAPSIPHQLIGGAVYAILRDFLMRKGASCMPFVSPVDVQLDRDNRTILQPDVMIVCDRSKITYTRIFGAPDFVMEVLSPATKTKDMLIKSAKYKHAGVREYWMVDPRQELTIKMLFLKADEEYPDGDTQVEVISFDDPVPVSVLGGELSICFREIADQYAFLQTSPNKR